MKIRIEIMLPIFLSVFDIKTGQEPWRSCREHQGIVSNWAGYVGHVFLSAPSDMGFGHVTLTIGTNREQFIRWAGDDHQPASKNRRRGNLAVQAANSPQLRAISRGVRNDPRHRKGDHL